MADRKRFGVERRKDVYAKNKNLRVEIIQLHHNMLVARYGEK